MGPEVIARRYAIAMVFLVAVLLAGAVVANTWYTQRALRRADLRWCSLLSISTTNDPPPTTERGRVAQREAKRLAHNFHCPLAGPSQ
jgi:hypothetical protein